MLLLCIVDTTPPEINSCPSDIIVDREIGARDTPIYWSLPSASDLSENVTLVTASHYPGEKFTSTTEVVYTFSDTSGNENSCVFVINFREGKSDITGKVEEFYVSCR